MFEIESYTTVDHLVVKNDKIGAQFVFSKKQYEVILALLQESENVSPPNVVNQCIVKSLDSIFRSYSWILDNGTTNHICPFKSFFKNLKSIPPISIYLPNQNHVTTKFLGTIVLGNLILYDLLFVLNFLTNYSKILQL